jgi:hypothetical protein
MKKLLTLFAVIALTAPVFAAEGDPNVVISCTDLTGGLVQVRYDIQYVDGLDPAARVRGFAFDITADNGCLITAISEYDAEGAGVPADSTQIPLLYSVYMGSIGFAVDPNFVSDFGDPIAPSGPPNNYPDTLGGLGTTGITVEMGSLYTGDNAPPAGGNLFKIKLTDPGQIGSCVLTIAGNSTRGESVFETGSPGNILSSGCTINFVTDCIDSTSNQALYDEWEAVGKPDCWCYEFNCRGDADGIQVGVNWVNSADVTILRNALFVSPLPPGPGICADFDRIVVGVNRVNSADVTVIRQHLFVNPLVSCPDINLPYLTP